MITRATWFVKYFRNITRATWFALNCNTHKLFSTSQNYSCCKYFTLDPCRIPTEWVDDAYPRKVARRVARTHWHTNLSKKKKNRPVPRRHEARKVGTKHEPRRLQILKFAFVRQQVRWSFCVRLILVLIIGYYPKNIRHTVLWFLGA